MTGFLNGQAFPRVQMIAVAELMAGKRPQMPTPITPYSTAARADAWHRTTGRGTAQGAIGYALLCGKIA